MTLNLQGSGRGTPGLRARSLAADCCGPDNTGPASALTASPSIRPAGSAAAAAAAAAGGGGGGGGVAVWSFWWCWCAAGVHSTLNTHPKSACVGVYNILLQPVSSQPSAAVNCCCCCCCCCCRRLSQRHLLLLGSAKE
jgi:hypothetical protein